MTAAVPAVDRLLDDGSGRRPRADARRNVERLVVAARQTAAKGDEGVADPDPWAGFTTFALSYIHLRNELCDVNKRLGDVRDHSRAELRDRIQRLVERAQQAGVMRTDVTWEDVAFLMVAASTGPHTL